MSNSLNDIDFDQWYRAFIRVMGDTPFDTKLHCLLLAMRDTCGITWYNSPEDSKKIVTNLYRDLCVLKMYCKLTESKHSLSSGYLVLVAENVRGELRFTLGFNTHLGTGCSD